jgi:WD40 repeat protein
LITVDTIEALEPLYTLTAHTDRVTDVAFSPDGAYLASSGREGKIRLWDTQSWQEIYTFDIHRSDMNVMAFSPRGNLLATSETVWDVANKQVVGEFNFTGEVGHVAFSPDGSTLAVAGFPPTLILWDVTSGERMRAFDRQAGALGYYSVEFSPDGKLLAAGGAANGTVTVWDVTTGQVTSLLEHGDQSDVHDLAFSPDGSLLAAGGTGSAVRIWELASGEVLHEIPLNSAIYGLAFSPDGKILALASSWSRAALLWDVESGEMLVSLPHADELMDVAFSPDGALLATGGYDNSVVIWGIPR